MNQGTLPRGTLAKGTDSLNETLSVFERAERVYWINENLPPSLGQMERENKKKYEDILKKVNKEE